MKKYGVLVVDDSAVMRKAITAIIEQHEQLYVVGIARNGVDAIDKAIRLKPNVITMDIEMPEMDGLEALQSIMQKSPTPIVMLTQQAIARDRAKQYGALDFFIKKDILNPKAIESNTDFYERLINAAQKTLSYIAPIEEDEPIVLSEPSQFEILIIGSSTGGPKALQKILTKIQPNFPVPILIVQHMPVGFTKALAKRFNQLCHVPVKEVEDGEKLRKGHIYIAPAGIQTVVQQMSENELVVNLQLETEVETLYRPSIDAALFSLAPISKENTLVVILTGMGDDGLRGCREVKAYNGHVISEHPDSCVIYGMPKVIFDANLSNQQVVIDDMYTSIIQTLMIK